VRFALPSWAEKVSPVLPLVACLFCPAHLLMFSALLAPLGIRVSVGEGSEWLMLLLAALSFVLVARTALRSASRWPLCLAIGSAVAFASVHLFGLPDAVEAGALALMTVASVWAHLARRAPCCSFDLMRANSHKGLN
jgi:hypothetical protein